MASLQQELLVGLMRVTRKKKQWRHLDRVLAKAREQQARGPVLPPAELSERVAVSRDDSAGFPVFTLGHRVPRGVSAKSALYLHGGGFVRDFAPGHFKLFATLIERTGIEIVAPGYPLAPDHTWRDSREAILALARRIAAEDPAPLVMGDSAGGGWAFLVAQALAAEGSRPEVVAISPFGDALLRDPRTREFDRRDPFLSAVGACAAFKAWAGHDDPARPEISPLSGSFAGIGRVLVFTGTRDVLHPQALQIADAARAVGVPCELVVEEGCVHMYALMPIPEARRAADKIVAFIDQRGRTDLAHVPAALGAERR